MFSSGGLVVGRHVGQTVGIQQQNHRPQAELILVQKVLQTVAVQLQAVGHKQLASDFVDGVFDLLQDGSHFVGPLNGKAGNVVFALDEVVDQKVVDRKFDLLFDVLEYGGQLVSV